MQNQLPDFILINSFPQQKEMSAPKRKSEFYLSKLCSQLGYKHETEKVNTLDNVFSVCRSLDIPIAEHFERVFFENGKEIVPDWKMTKLGMYLFIIYRENKSGGGIFENTVK